jgi:putative PIG3 family NAD(P)H quinone oxidoreductase
MKGMMRAVEFTGAGGPEVVRVCDRPMPTPAPGEILLKVEAAGVNRPDVTQRRGFYPPPPGASDIPGLDVAGVVVDEATGVAGPAKGESVCALVTGGGYAEYCAVPVEQVLPLPEGFSFAEAAALPEIFFTAWNNLVLHGGLAAGERTLFQGGTSGVCIAAMQIAKQLFGARVIATASSREKRHLCLQLGADGAIDYRDEDWPAAAMRANGGEPFDYILDAQAGDYVAKHMAIMAPDARLVMLAAHRGATGTIDFLEIVRRRLVITGSTIRPRPPAYKKKIANALLERVWPLLAQRSIVVPLQEVLPLERAVDAHRILDANEQMGKIVLTLT